MKKIIIVAALAAVVTGCAGTPSNSYTIDNAAGVSSWELCRNIGYHEFFNRTQKAQQLTHYIIQRGDVDPQACQAEAAEGKTFAAEEYRKTGGY
ncbi:lipoprotein [Photobacterium toruni]|uniref:Type IV secretion system putative lipoprotein virB7 n=1 Tax=Photobacterium toruni TaxID=1935446 RepID=A0A1T4MBC8_9GAMM|nr:lipoprotein [Photobacterium toruni]MEC6815961.1 lipoprotein [Photobacterium toruni]MEC6831579.1 lipoprotein [Photobacterium toruni]SJZ64293.1 hypothetical protein CZ814_00477 [Photobacterium toruni]